MISLTFSSGPWGPKCLKYQNVPNLGSFRAIGKRWERFQSWDIRIYFISVPKDHTVNLNISIFTYVFSLLFLFLISCNRPIWWWCIPHSNQVTSQQIVTFSSIITHKCWLSRWIHFQSTDRSKWAVHTYSICFPSRHHTSNRHITIKKHLLLKW